MTLYFLTFENTQKFKKYRNVTVLYANNKNINECNKYEFIDEEEDEEEENGILKNVKIMKMTKKMFYFIKIINI